MIFYLLYKIGYFIANILPLKAAYWLSERVSDMQYFLAKKDRDNVAHNLSIILNKDINECYISARRVFRNFGLYLVDFFRMPQLTEEAINKRVKVINMCNADKVLKQNKGAVLVTCHIGNWEMGGVVIAMMGYNISAVALNHKHKNINDFFIKQREEKGLKVITMKSVMKRCVSTLQKKGMLALVGDRDFTNNGIILNFFGVPTSIPKGPAMLSIKTDSPIIPGIFVRDGKYNYKLIIDEPIYPQEIPGASHDELIKGLTEKFLVNMERFIRTYPDQWLVFRKFWETPVDALAV